jgi:alcohol dehydrogenase YqhD (iron-dependent ADH family)
MLGNFTYYNPTRLHFGRDALDKLNDELEHVGQTVQLIYGGGSIKKSGLYDKVVGILKAHGKTIVEDGGVMPNPTTDKLREGVKIARENHVDFLLAVGGGSCCDYAKAVAVSVNCDEDPWERYYLRYEDVAPGVKVVPLGCVLTMAGTGSEMNSGSVITDTKTHLKIGKVFAHPDAKPVFSIMNPEVTFTLPEYQLKSGIFDIFCHLCEQYFSGTDNNTSDYLTEGLLRNVIHDGPLAVKDPTNYELRSNIMWAATWALNTLVGMGKSQDWMVHMMGQAVGGVTNATHGMTLAAVSLPYYRYILDDGLPKFRRFAVEVWGVDGTQGTDREIALEGLARMEAWMKSLGVAMSLTELGVKPTDIDAIADGTLLLDGGYKKMTRDDVVAVLKAAL